MQCRLLGRGGGGGAIGFGGGGVAIGFVGGVVGKYTYYALQLRRTVHSVTFVFHSPLRCLPVVVHHSQPRHFVLPRGDEALAEPSEPRRRPHGVRRKHQHGPALLSLARRAPDPIPDARAIRGRECPVHGGGPGRPARWRDNGGGARGAAKRQNNGAREGERLHRISVHHVCPQSVGDGRRSSPQSGGDGR